MVKSLPNNHAHVVMLATNSPSKWLAPLCCSVAIPGALQVDEGPPIVSQRPRPSTSLNTQASSAHPHPQTRRLSNPCPPPTTLSPVTLNHPCQPPAGHTHRPPSTILKNCCQPQATLAGPHQTLTPLLIVTNGISLWQPSGLTGSQTSTTLAKRQQPSPTQQPFATLTSIEGIEGIGGCEAWQGLLSVVDRRVDEGLMTTLDDQPLATLNHLVNPWQPQQLSKTLDNLQQP